MPAWLLVVLLSMATYRCTRLITKDDFPPVLWMRDRIAGGWRPITEKERRQISSPGLVPWSSDLRDVDHGRGKTASRYMHRWSWVPEWLADLVSCPWCASGWISMALTAYAAGVLDSLTWRTAVIIWAAVWGAGALLASKEWA